MLVYQTNGTKSWRTVVFAVLTIRIAILLLFPAKATFVLLGVNNFCEFYPLLHGIQTTATASSHASQLVPQTNNILVGYEWAAAFVLTSMGQEIFETVPLHSSYLEPSVYECEQMLAPFTRF